MACDDCEKGIDMEECIGCNDYPGTGVEVEKPITFDMAMSEADKNKLSEIIPVKRKRGRPRKNPIVEVVKPEPSFETKEGAILDKVKVKLQADKEYAPEKKVKILVQYRCRRCGMIIQDLATTDALSALGRAADYKRHIEGCFLGVEGIGLAELIGVMEVKQ